MCPIKFNKNIHEPNWDKNHQFTIYFTALVFLFSRFDNEKETEIVKLVIFLWLLLWRRWGIENEQKQISQESSNFRFVIKWNKKVFSACLCVRCDSRSHFLSIDGCVCVCAWVFVERAFIATMVNLFEKSRIMIDRSLSISFSCVWVYLDRCECVCVWIASKCILADGNDEHWTISLSASV